MTKTLPRRMYAMLAVFALTIVGFPPARAAAQVSTGSIAGTVLDSTGQLVPGAQVTIRNVNRNTSTTFVTDQNGAYTALFLVPGTYEVQVTLQGFKSWVRSDLVLQVNDRLRIDASLEVGGIEEKTTVMASSPVVRTDTSEVGTVIEETAIKELPLNGRNFATLVYLVPGITPGQAGENLSGASTFNPRGASNFNALGHQANSNAWLVDGIDNNEFTFNTVIVAPSVEQVARVQGAVGGVLGRVRPRRGRRVGVDQVGHQPAARHRLRVPAQRRLRRAQLLRAQDGTAPDGVAGQGPGAATQSPPVRRRPRRGRGDSRPLRRPRPHVLLWRLRRHQGAPRRHDGQHGAQRCRAHRRLQQLPR